MRKDKNVIFKASQTEKELYQQLAEYFNVSIAELFRSLAREKCRELKMWPEPREAAQ